MKVIKPDNLSLLYASFMLERRLVLSVAAMGFFTLDTASEERLLPEAEMWKVVPDVLEKDENLDLCLPKPRGEYLVYGSCFSREPVQGMLVTVDVGTLSKTLQVSGDHTVSAGIPGRPTPFTSMKIAYGNAYGGPGYDLNPLGKGYARDDRGIRHMPNIQDPKDLVVDLGSRGHLPAGFTAYPMMWPERARHLGSFDSLWLQDRWPHYPLDTNPEYFNAAPEDQRLREFFNGDEPVRILNMHPEKPELVSSLPAVRARIFVNKMVGGHEEFVEAAAHPETVWLFPDRERGIVLFRGITPIQDEEMDDVLHLMAEWEPLAEEPKSLEHYHNVFLKTIHPEEAAAAEPAAVEVEGVPAPEAPAEEKAPEAPGLTPELAAFQKEIEALEKQTDARLKELGMTRKEVLKKYLPEPEPGAPFDPKEFEKAIGDLEKETDSRLKELGMSREEVMKKFMPATQQETPTSPRDLLKQIADLENQTEGKLKELGMSRDEVLKKYIPEAGLAVPPISLKELEALIATHEAEAEAAAKAAREVLKPLALTEAELSAEGSPMTVEAVMERCRRGESLSGLDLGGLDFRGMDLSGADLRETVLEKTVFTEAELIGTDFSGALLTDGDFSEADMEGARFCKANGTGCRFAGARMRLANLAEGDFTSADFSGADLSEAVLERGVFEKALFHKVKAAGVKAARADFWYADLTEADFRSSEMKDTDLSYTNLTRARLGGLQAAGLRLHGATGEGTDFSRALLQESRGDKDTAFTGASLRGADLSRSCWDGTKLIRVRMEEAILDQANFSKAQIRDSHLVNASARGTDFMKADFENTDMRGINLFKGSMRKAGITQCNLRDSNLYGVDLYKAKIKGSDMERANVNNTLLTVQL